MSGDSPDEDGGGTAYPYTAWESDKEFAHMTYNASNRKNRRLRQIMMLPNYYTSSVARRIARAEPALVAKHVDEPLKKWGWKHSSTKAIFLGFSNEMAKKVIQICDQADDDRLATIWADIPRKDFAESTKGRMYYEATNTPYVYSEEDDLAPCDIRNTFNEVIPQGANLDQYEVLGIRRDGGEVEAGKSQESDSSGDEKESEAEIDDD